MKICGIYKITSPSGRIYIGQSIDIQKRWNQYKYNSCKSQTKLYNSLKKYGWENHKFEIIEECSKEELSNREKFWESTIEKKCLLNIIECGKTPPKNNKQSFIERYGAKEGIKKWNSYINNKSIKASGKIAWNKGKTGNQSHMYGIIVKENSKIKQVQNSKYNKLYQYDKEGNFIKEWERISIAKKELNISINCTTNLEKIKYSGGYIWFSEKHKYLIVDLKKFIDLSKIKPKRVFNSYILNEMQNRMRKIAKNKEYHEKAIFNRESNLSNEDKLRRIEFAKTLYLKSNLQKSILQYDLDGNFIKKWSSITEAAKTIDSINFKSIIPKIIMVAKGKRNKTRGFKWCYEKMEI